MYFKYIFQDWKVNNTKGKVIMLLFRMANFCTKGKVYYYLGLPYILFYKIFVGWFIGIEIAWCAKIGKNLRIYHGTGLVVHEETIIGNDCTLRHCTTLGNKQLIGGEHSSAPRLGNNVDIGANTCIIGEIEIGDNVKIGCGSVVTKNIPADSTAVGNPARIINKPIN